MLLLKILKCYKQLWRVSTSVSYHIVLKPHFAGLIREWIMGECNKEINKTTLRGDGFEQASKIRALGTFEHFFITFYGARKKRFFCGKE